MKPEPQIYFDREQVDKYVRTRFSPKVFTYYKKWAKAQTLGHGDMLFINKDMASAIQPPVRNVVDFLIEGLGQEIRII